VNSVLKVINLADNQFGESNPDLILEMCKVFENPTSCGYFDLQYNGIYDEGNSNNIIAVVTHFSPDIISECISNK